jgi:hypothetical protein
VARETQPAPILSRARTSKTQRRSTTTQQRIVILGGGFAGLRALSPLHDALDDRVALILVDPRETSLARPMLPEVALAGRPVAHARFPLAGTVHRQGGTFIQSTAEQIDPAAGEVILGNGSRLVGRKRRQDYRFNTRYSPTVWTNRTCTAKKSVRGPIAATCSQR